MQATVAADTAVSSWQPSDEASEVETPLPNCKSKIATILDNDSACRERPQVLQDFEYVQVFVTDYINYRLSLESVEWPQRPILCLQTAWDFQLMRDVIHAFEKMHSAELKNMVCQLFYNKSFSWQHYTEIVMNFGLINDETTSEMSYGRIVALIAFAGLVAVYAVKNDTRQHITPMMMYTSKFIERRILMTWDRGDCGSEKRSWAEFFELARVMRDRQQLYNWRYKLTEWFATSWLPWISIVGFLALSVFSLSKAIAKH